jgi:hypothetical protein
MRAATALVKQLRTLGPDARNAAAMARAKRSAVAASQAAAEAVDAAGAAVSMDQEKAAPHLTTAGLFGGIDVPVPGGAGSAAAAVTVTVAPYLVGLASGGMVEPQAPHVPHVRRLRDLKPQL